VPEQQPPSGGAILLAAGFSRRFGSDKRRHVLGDGRSLLQASVALYAAAFARLVVVLRPGDDDLAAGVEALCPHAQIVRCADAAEGMGRSLAAGARAARTWGYAFVALADMPWVRPETLQRLRRALEAAAEDAIVVPVHQGRPGHPVGFAARYLDALAELGGEAGARRVVEAAGERVLRIEVDDPGVLKDLDAPPTSG